ncbi:hypothetical protein WJX73_003304 [Symbiochloris irregularis]|uniref:carotenoid 9,10-dioxygenase n=1 Tax=Symbiochloris irregularis TaxID=706552 RepID=A0AAW1PKK3_9CHLO
MRTGPNPYFVPRGDYHWFDGDGMLHACRIKSGQVSYCNKFVDTFRLTQEKRAGAALFMKLGDMQGISGICLMFLSSLQRRLGFTNNQHGAGTANTALVYHARKLMSLHEGDLPYAMQVLCNGLIESLGRVEFDGKVDHPFTAHPKLDPATGELFFIGYKLDSGQARLWYSALNPQGELMFDQSVQLKHAVMHHDFAITQNHALIIDHCLEFCGKAMVKEGTLPFRTNHQRNARIGVLPKRPKDPSSKGANVRWFELDQPLVFFHSVNAWEEQDGDIIRLFLCFYKHMDLSGKESTHPPAEVGEVRLNLRTGTSELRVLAPGVYGDFPRVPQHLIGQPSRFAYISTTIWPSSKPVMDGLAKYDLTKTTGDSVIGRLSFGPNHTGGEAFFVPSHTDPAQCSGEDDGYLVTFVHDMSASTKGSALVVYDAKTMSSTPVAHVPLPQRVPNGFHAHHMNEAEFYEHLQYSRSAGSKFASPL